MAARWSAGTAGVAFVELLDRSLARFAFYRLFTNWFLPIE